jgi:ribonuclease E
MGKRMLIDAAHPEETRVVVLSGNRLEEFDFESSTKKQVKGNIYLAKVTRVEPSLQAAFIDYGGNRHGFLAFSEIHPDYYRIPVSDRGAGESEAPPAEDGWPRETAESAILADEAPIAIADALPEAAPVVAATEEDAADAEIAEPPDTIEEMAGEGPATQDSAAEEASRELPADVPGEVNDIEMAAPIEAIVSSDPFFESASAPPAEDVETLDDDAEAEAEEAETERRRSSSLRHYKIQEVVKRRQIMLVQVAKEERGNKGAALTTYLSLAGRYCVLMPNTARGGGVSRKITSISDRRRLKEILEDLEIPEGMGVIVRTAGSERSKAEIKRDYEYLMRLWSEIRELTLKSTAPALIYEEGNLIKRSIRDLYARDIDEVIVEGDEGYKTAKTFMRMLTPSHAKRVQAYRDPLVGLFHKYQVESQIDAVHSPIAQLRSGGYIVINQTEALVSIDVNSGRATRERNIEETALRTNLEASDEIARQLRLRDLAGLIVIDFIDMEEYRHNSAVERRLKEALKNDRARIQVGRISAFGLMEMSRQRLRPSLAEASTLPCPHCGGTGFIRSTESTALHVLRAIEEEGARARSAEICIYVPTGVALYLLNQKRDSLAQIEARYGLRVIVGRDDALIPPNFRLERLRAYAVGEAPQPRLAPPPPPEIEEEDEDVAEAPLHHEAEAGDEPDDEPSPERAGDDERGGRRRRRRRGRRGEEGHEPRRAEKPALVEAAEDASEERQPAAAEAAAANGERDADADRRRRRRGRRGGRWRNREGGAEPAQGAEELVEAAIESAEIPLQTFEGAEAGGSETPSPFFTFEAEGGELPSPFDMPQTAAIDELAVEAVVEAAIESAEIPLIEPEAETERQPERVLEIAAAGNGAAAEAEPEIAQGERSPSPSVPEGVDIHAVTEKPESPRRGWWTRLIQ